MKKTRQELLRRKEELERELRSVNEALQLKGERRRSVSVSTPTVPAEATLLKRVRFLSTNGDSSEF